ncbi:MAG TPA: VWA domain-containing protein, partial [Thauera sp.]|nr:VWA domain-containing protein [Thauera sp.]
VSDGSPADIDVFDPQHLVEDARVAVSEARRSGVRCAGLMLGEDGREAARRIFGINGHR